MNIIPKKKNEIVDAVVDITAGGAAGLVGGNVTGALGSLNPALAGVERAAQSGIQLASVGLPIRGSSAVLKELKKKR